MRAGAHADPQPVQQRRQRGHGVHVERQVAVGRPVGPGGRPRRPGDEHLPGARGPQCRDHLRPLLGVRGVRGAQHRDDGTGPAVRGRRSVRPRQRARRDRLDACGGEQVRHEGGPRGEPGGAADGRQERLRSHRARGEVGVGAVPEPLVRCGVPGRCERSRDRLRRGRRKRRLGQVRELADPGERCAPVRDVVVAAGPRRGDALREQAGRHRSHEATGGLELLQPRPRGAAEVGGERLDVPGAAPGIGHPADVRLLQQQQLRVPGQPGREAPGDILRTTGDRGVERQHGDHVGAPDAGGERRDRRAQQVHPRVALRHHRRRRDGVLAHAARLRCAEHVGDARPEPAGGAELGDALELVVGHGEPEVDVAQGRWHREASIDKSADVAQPGRDGRPDLLRVARAGVVQHRAVDEQGPHRPARRSHRAAVGDECERHRLVETRAGSPGPVAQQRGVGVGSETDVDGAGVVGIGGPREQQGRGRGDLGARVQHHRHEVDVYSCEQRHQLAHGSRPADGEPQRRRPAGEVGEQTSFTSSAGAGVWPWRTATCQPSVTSRLAVRPRTNGGRPGSGGSGSSSRPV